MSITRKIHQVRKITTYELDDRIDNYIEWYYNNIVKYSQTDIKRDGHSIQMRNLIEKVAVWYELRFPDYEINRLMPGSDQEKIYVSDEMFNKNHYINNLFANDTARINLEWDKFYNSNVFINSLPYEERILFANPRYSNLIYINKQRSGIHFHLSPDGYVEAAEYIYINGHGEDYFIGKHIKEVAEFMKTNNALPEDNELEPAIASYERSLYQKEEMLNCIMYRIIEHGGNRIGPRRAFLFAKEFGRNIDIPMLYGIDSTDPGLGAFIEEYIKAGGSKDLVCIVNYHSRKKINQKLEIATIGELIPIYCRDIVIAECKSTINQGKKLILERKE